MNENLNIIDSKTVDMSPLVFISHDTRDAELAQAFSTLLNGVSAGNLRAFWSSDKLGDEGIAYGKEWYKTIESNINRATDVVCLLTQRSLNRPWILYEAGLARCNHRPVFGLTLGTSMQHTSSSPFALFENCGDSENELMKLVFQLLERIPNAKPSQDSVRTQVREFKAWVAEILGTMPADVSDCKAVILAAGKSARWLASIQDSGGSDYYSTLYWKNVNKNLMMLDLPELDSPPQDPGLHKSCSNLDTFAIIHHAFLSYSRCGIKNLLAVVSNDSPAQQQIVRYINMWNSTNKLRVSYDLIGGDSETAYSAFFGLSKLPGVIGDIIVSYSDIVWEDRLLQRLLNQQQGDIVVLVDTSWPNNYPRRRIWHDEVYAELIFGKNGCIEKVGEICNRFENIPDWSIDSNRVEGFQSILQQDCIGEIVGLFKFTPKGRRVFCEAYSGILGSLDDSISLAEWVAPHIFAGTRIRPRPGRLPIRRALLSCFLEHLCHQNTNIDVRIVETNGGWAEIDHWGDICLATERLRYDHPFRLNLTPISGDRI